MAEFSSSSTTFKEGSGPAGSPGEVPDARAARDRKGHFYEAFKHAAVRYAMACGKSQRAAARDMGISDKTLCGWISDARPEGAVPPARTRPASPAGAATAVVDVETFDELARLRAQTRELLAVNGRLASERDFLKKSGGLLRGPVPGRFKVIEQNKDQFAVGLMCRLMGVSRQGYYDWARRAIGKITSA